MFRVLVPFTLLFVSVPAFAQIDIQEQPQQPQTKAAQAKSQNRVICRDIGEIGSRLASKRVCMTADQWKQQEQADRDSVADQQHRSTIPD